LASRLAIVAGGGPMPRRLADSARSAGRDVFILNLDGITDPSTADGLPSATVGIGQLGRAIEILHREKVTEICMIGPVKRPSLSAIGMDSRGLSLLPKILRHGRGDDALLRIVVGELEGEGFRVVGAHEVEASLLAPSGRLGRHAPDGEAEQDVALGVRVARALGALDVGQAVVVQQGQVVGVEGIEGTDRLLERCGELRLAGRGGVLVKLKKPQQERRADLPTIGTDTVARAAAAGLVGIAIEADQTLLVDRDATIAACDASGLFLLGIVPAP
jgi:UDP-2,3-diacylglucosamine hydrolase